MENQDKKFALLIDADNIGSQYIKTIVDEITKEGVITYKRIYGDWTKPNLGKWKDILLDYSITPVQQYAYTTGKNATDSAMIIDAMDILYTQKVDGFCLASSDSDFTKLAARLREAGMVVIGMGKQQTPRPFVSACSMFKYIDIISGEEENDISENNKAANKQDAKQADNSQQKAEREIQKYIQRAIAENSGDDGWFLVSKLGDLLHKKYADFDPRNFGEKKLVDVLKKWNFETKAFQDPNFKQNPSGMIMFVRNRD